MTAHTEENRTAGRDTPTDRAIAMVPRGYRLSMLLIAYIKRALNTCRIRQSEQLFFLESINGLTDAYLTAAMLTTIGPMSDTEARMFEEAVVLDEGKKRCRVAYDLLTRAEVFSLFVGLNPSLRKAIQMRQRAT